MAISALELLILALAAFRLTRVVVADSILDEPRNRLIGRLIGHGRAGERVAELITCSWCAGWWISLAVYAIWVTASPAEASVVGHLLGAAAVAGAQGLLSALEPS